MFDAAIVGTRLLQFTAALVLFGSSLYFLYGFKAVRPDVRDFRGPKARHLLIGASVIALVASILWYMAETAALTGEPWGALNAVALQSVFVETRFGKLGALRAGLLAVAIIALLRMAAGKPLWITQAALGGAVVASFAWSGHGAMNRGLPGLIHLGSDILHLLAAGAWIGALVPLSILLGRRGTDSTPSEMRRLAWALERFSGVGPAAVAVLIVTGLVNSAFLLDLTRLRASLTSPYGRTLLVKLGLFAGMLVLAAVNRYRLAPALAASLSEHRSVSGVLHSLRTSVVGETILAILVVAAVAVLGTLEPPLSGSL